MTASSAMSSSSAPGARRRDTVTLTILSEVALLLVHLSVVVGFSRLYEDRSFVGVLTAYVMGAHLLAAVARRRNMHSAIVALVAVIGAAVVTTWSLFPSSTWFGLPTGQTFNLAHDAVRLSRSRFGSVAAPVPVTPGFQLVSGLVLWCSVWFADWAAFRLRATVEAIAPPAVLFTFGAMLGSGQYRISSAVSFTAAVLFFAAVHRAWRAQLDEAWLSSSSPAGPRALLRAGVGLAGLALIAGAVVGPRLPGAASDALVSWRNGRAGGGDRTTVSPIVDLRKRLVNQSDTELFTVTAQHRSYWRLTALDRFDGKLWSSDGQFANAEGSLRSSNRGTDRTRANRQTITVRALSTIWVPVAYEARSINQTSEKLRWDPESGTLIVEASGGDQENTSNGLQYTVVSEAPVIDPSALRRAGTTDSAAIEKQYGGLPVEFPVSARRAAESVTAAATDRYSQALALQNWFRSEFEYSLDVPAGNGDDALVQFLTSRRGYCEQFSGAYAAMARWLGIPSRVAVGFTPGEADAGGRRDDEPTRYTVLGRHAHAWPELWFPRVGWVPFEPTPGRGIPGAEAYTNVVDAQDDHGSTAFVAPSTTTSTSVVAGPSTTAASDTPQAERPDPRLLTAAADQGRRGTDGPIRVLIGLTLAMATLLIAVLLAPWFRARKRRTDQPPAGLVLDAWHQALAPVRWLTGLRPRPAETHLEFSQRAAGPLGQLDGRIDQLAILATSAAWDPVGASVEEANRARGLARDLRDDVLRHQSVLQRTRRRLSWREAFDRPRRSATP